MLRTRPTKGQQRVVGGCIAFEHGDLADGIGHVLGGEGEKLTQQIITRDGATSLLKNGLLKLKKPGFCGIAMNRNRRPCGIEATEEEVDISDRERAAFAIAGRAGIRAGAVWTHREAAWRPCTNATATCGHGFDGHGRTEQRDSTDMLMKAITHGTINAGHVRARAAHVERDDLGVAHPLGGIESPQHASSGAGEKEVLGLDG